MIRSPKLRVFAAIFAVFALTGVAVAAPIPSQAPAPTGIHKIQHVVVLMQENRSFDNYFGTYPGADGIPMKNGVPTVCVPNTARTCVKPYVDHEDVNGGGPHAKTDATQDVNRGKMNGFIASWRRALTGCKDPNNPQCTGATNKNGVSDVMGYHTQSDIPNYWSYAQNFVLQDHMFQPNASWSLPEHLFQVSEWSADCPNHQPTSCTNADMPTPKPGNGDPTNPPRGKKSPIYAWTDLTYLLHKNNVPWGYYVVAGTEPDCANDAQISCTPLEQNAKTPGIWNPLPYFDTVHQDKQTKNIKSIDKFYEAAKQGDLPAVSWIAPSGDVSEHPPAPITNGVAYTTSLINAVMNGPDWDSTAIFLAWDDWGGFYDNVVPPKVDANGYGLRVPGLVISPYAKKGFIDHQTLSFDAYVKFIEDDFLGGQRLDPSTDGRPDQRPTVRENVPILGDLAKDFDFNQAPRPPMVLSVHPKSTLENTPDHPLAADIPSPETWSWFGDAFAVGAIVLALLTIVFVLWYEFRRPRLRPAPRE